MEDFSDRGGSRPLRPQVGHVQPRRETFRRDHRVAAGLAGTDRAEPGQAERGVGGPETAQEGDLGSGQDHGPLVQGRCPCSGTTARRRGG
jgi:hypothetical protein